jgi:ABC-type transport system involved in cytochrome c biogenesis permease subunit
MTDERRSNGWTLGIVSVALFMAVLGAGAFVVLVLPFRAQATVDAEVPADLGLTANAAIAAPSGSAAPFAGATVADGALVALVGEAA